MQRRCSAVAHPPKYPDYAGQLLDYLSPLPPKSSSTAVLTTVGEQATLDRILAKIGKKFIPDDLNRMALWIAVKQAADDKKNVDRYRSRARTHAIVKSMKRVRNAAESLAAVIKENEDSRELLVVRSPLEWRGTTAGFCVQCLPAQLLVT